LVDLFEFLLYIFVFQYRGSVCVRFMVDNTQWQMFLSGHFRFALLILAQFHLPASSEQWGTFRHENELSRRPAAFARKLVHFSFTFQDVTPNVLHPSLDLIRGSNSETPELWADVANSAPHHSPVHTVQDNEDWQVRRYHT